MVGGDGVVVADSRDRCLSRARAEPCEEWFMLDATLIRGRRLFNGGKLPSLLHCTHITTACRELSLPPMVRTTG